MTFEIAVSFFLGLAAGLIVFGTLRAKLNQEDQDLIKELEETNTALKTEAKSAVEALNGTVALLSEELAKAKWSLNGRIRGPDDPPIYLMPPGEGNTGRCDDARIAWMDTANKAAEMMRAAGFGESADKIHPATRAATQQLLAPSNPKDFRKKERPM